jgi:hypothetical protein
MSLKLTTTPFHYEGKHSEPGAKGTTLSFDVLLEHRPVDGEGNVWVAGVEVHNGSELTKAPSKATLCSAKAFGKDPLAALERLAVNLRRVSESIDAQLDKGVIVPIALHRRKKSDEKDELDKILSEGDGE